MYTKAIVARRKTLIRYWGLAIMHQDSTLPPRKVAHVAHTKYVTGAATSERWRSTPSDPRNPGRSDDGQAGDFSFQA